MKNWCKIRSATRLSLSLMAITALMVWSAKAIKVIPCPEDKQVSGRLQLCETIALQSTSSIKSNRIKEFSQIANAVVERNPDLKSLALRRSNGNYAFATSQHHESWAQVGDSNSDQVTVYVDVNGRSWGTLEVGFQPIAANALSDLIGMILFVSAGTGVMSWIVLSRTLRYLNPTKVVPQRVRSAFETLAEGLMLLDKSGTIVHANGRLAKMVGIPFEELVGSNVSEIPWHTESESNQFSWQTCLESKDQVCGELMKLDRNGTTFMYSANAAPIFESNGSCRGVMVSFDDVTALENKKADLARMVSVLQTSRDQVAKQNVELQFLASRDPLTKCYNRRSFWEIFEQAWEKSEIDRLNVIMIDIDHFKSINDTHGHSVGDDVLRDLGELLLELFVDDCLVCRFGGEEFAILLTNAGIDEATVLASKLRNKLGTQTLGELSVTASIGIANRSFGAMDPQHLLDQADQSLYVAKRTGRDRVVRFDQLDKESRNTSENDEPKSTQVEQPMEYSVVTGLLTALAFRSKSTVEHSMRVADLSVALGRQFLPASRLYELEIGALLHDVGMVGIAENSFGSTSNSAAEHRFAMNRHDAIGAEIVKLSFGSQNLTDIIRCQNYWYATPNHAVRQDLLKHHIPVGARIVAICNAMDNLMADGLEKQRAVETLRERSSEFDPELVEILSLMIARQPDLLTNKPRLRTTAHHALAVGKHMETLYEALETKDIDLMKTCVRALQRDAAVVEGVEVCNAAYELDIALQSSDGEQDEMIEMAQQVIDLCRTTRDSFIVSKEVRKLSRELV